MTQRIRYAQSGQRLSARYVNKLVDGANRALEVLGPPRSKLSPEITSQQLDSDEENPFEFLGSEVFQETGRATSTVRIYDPNDSTVFVDVERIDKISFQSSNRRIVFFFNNS